MLSLSRPTPAPIDDPLTWPGTVVSVFGPGDKAFGDELARAAGAGAIEVRLRRVAGFKFVDGRISCAPDALLEALRDNRPDAAIVVGVGPAFALAVRCALTVWITDGAHLLSLPSPLRPIAKHAQLQLEDARLAVAARLGAALAA